MGPVGYQKFYVFPFSFRDHQVVQKLFLVRVICFEDHDLLPQMF